LTGSFHKIHEICVWRLFGLAANVAGCIYEVNQRRARLVLGWVSALLCFHHM